MESFLTTLPPYVHDFLNKYPPTDVFNVLRELICFAVLYYNDRERILAMSKELIEKGADKPPPLSIQSVSTRISDEKENEAQTTETTVASPRPVEEPYNTTKHSSDGDNEKKKADTMPWTFPEWWGHREANEPVKPQQGTNKDDADEKKDKVTRRETVSTWVPWDEPSVVGADTRSGRFSSTQVTNPIPDLRSYLRTSSKPITRTASQRSNAASNLKKEELETRRMSAPVQTPPKLSTRPSKTPSTSSTRAGSSDSSSPSSVSPPSSRPSSVLRPAGMTATVRARAERAKAQQQQLEQQKVKDAQLNTINSRVRQQAKPAVDWDAIKKERRRTMPPISSSAASAAKE